jgi:hypothetical protein
MQKMIALGLALACGLVTTAALADEPAGGAAPAAPAPAAPAAAGASAGASSSGGGAGISVGLRAGYAIPMGDAEKNSKMSDFAKGAIPFQLDALYRVTPNLGVGLYASYAIVSPNKDNMPSGIDVSASWMKYGVQLQYSISPGESMSPWVGYGIGLESVKLTASASGISTSFTTSGLEFAHVMAGLDFKAGDALRVGPFVDVSLGQYSSSDPGGDIQDKAMHQWLFLGVRGMYDL